MQIVQLQGQGASTAYTAADARANRLVALREAHRQLLNAIAVWKSNYLLVAPFEGQVSFTTSINEGQFMAAGNEVLTVVPSSQSQLIGRMELPALNAGKVAVGQRVNVKLTSFPYHEYGMVSATVSTIGLVTNKGNYAVSLLFPQGLQTNRMVTLPFHQELQGSAEIITKNRRLLQRFFDKMRYEL